MKFEKEVMQNLAMVTQLGISMLAPIILCVFAGHWLDERFGFHSVIVLLLFGIAAGVRNCYLIFKNSLFRKKEKRNMEDKVLKSLISGILLCGILFQAVFVWIF